MKQKRIGCVVTAVVTGMQLVSALPVTALTVPGAADTGGTALTAFAEQITAVTQQDENRSFYETVCYDSETGLLSADGVPTDSCGDLKIRNGELMIVSAAPDSRLQTAGTIRRFADAAAEYGYETESDGSLLTVTNEFQTARLIVKAKGQIDPHGAQKTADGYNDLHIFQYADTAAAYAAYQLYQQDPAVQYVQPSHIVQIDPIELESAEESTVSALDTGSYMTWGAGLIGTEQFYDTYLKGKELPEVKVAVIDTGLNTAPALFAGRVLEGGVNFSSSGNDSFADDISHGTHVSGTICELTPDNVKILPIKSFDSSGTASDEQIYAGIMYALENDADVLNMSFGGLGVNPLEVEAMMIAEKKGIICCAAAGNNSDDARYFYPSSIESCITVAAVGEDMKRADFSNYGDMIDVSAPGVGIRSYGMDGPDKQESKNGTSMATPHVTACCALLCSYDPEITAARAENLLCLNAADLGDAGFDADTGWGLVCMKNFHWDEGICKAPVFSRKAGNYGTEQTVSITAESPDMQIYYTTDGTLPDRENGTLYTEPLVIAESTRVLAIAVKDKYIDSVPAEAIYTIGGKDIAGALVIEDGTVKSYTGIRKSVTIPETADGVPVTAVAAAAFAGNHAVETVKLPESVTEIGDGAFKDCVDLETVTAPGVKTVGSEAFFGDAALKTVTLHEDADSLGASVFEGCVSLKEMELPQISRLPDRCFADCTGLKKLTVPAVTEFGSEACLNCAALTELYPDWRQVKALGSGCLSGCKAFAGSLTLDSLETLGDGVFAGDKALLRVSLPETVTVLPKGSFSDCSGLRLLELPGITELRENAIALGTCSEAFTLVLDYGKIKSAGTNAFCGARLGTGFDTVTFSALETLEFRSFGGVIAGVIELPLVKHVPRYAFASAILYGAVLENAETLETESMFSVKAVKLTDAAKEIAADAFDAETYIHAPETLSALDACENIHRCQEPLVMRVNTKMLQVSLHEYGAFLVTAMGDGLTYQWYRLNGEAAEPLAGETGAVFAPESGRIGEYDYRCVVTDAAGKTEQFDLKAVISGAHAYTELQPETPLFADGTETGFYQLTVPESGEWYLESAGEAPLNGLLTDENGKKCGEFALQPDHSARMTADLTAGQTYYLVAAPRWQRCCSLLLTKAHTEKTLLADCTVSLIPTAFGSFDADWYPALKVVSPSGAELTEGTDYTVQITQRNMHYQLDLFGLGHYQGNVTVRTDVIDRIPKDTPVPVVLSGKEDRATVLFIPEETGTYYFYGSVDPRCQPEWAGYLRSGVMRSQRFTNVMAACVVSSKPDGEGTVFASSAYSNQNDGQFCGSLRMNAGQMYYLTCSLRETRDAEFSIVISDRLRDIREADLKGNFYAVYEDDMIYEPKIKLTYEGELLTEGQDYVVMHSGNEVPGSAKILLAGTGLFIGRVERSYEIIYPMQEIPEQTVPLGETTAVSCEQQKYQTVWFRADRAENNHTNARYRVLNEQTAGSALQYQIYRLDEKLKTLSPMQAMQDDKNDYMLKNGLYCVSVSRKYAERGGATNITVVEPYALAEAEMTVTDAVYTGGKVEAPVTLTMKDGTVLQQGRDYIVAYAEDDANVMFGEVPFTLRSTKYSYGSGAGSYRIKVKLPEEEPPELTPGEHAVPLTLDDRLAWYQLTAEEAADYLLVSDDIPDIVLRVFTPEADMTEQCAGTGIKALSFYVPKGDTRYIMVKYNGLLREGTLHFRLETEQRALADCEAIARPVTWTGEKVKPDIVLRDGSYTLIEGTDYDQRYIVNDTDIGTATVNYIGKGRYAGMLDVEFPIVMPKEELADLCYEKVLDIPLKPLMLDYEYEVKNTEENRYLIFSYYSVLEADIRLSVYDARCKLSVQMYDSTGNYLGDAFFSRKGELITDVWAEQYVLFLFSATDISSSNQYWKMQLTDLTHENMQIVEDTENGVLYRVDTETRYAEAYGIIPGRSTYTFTTSVYAAEYDSLFVEHYQPGLFAEIPKTAVVKGRPSGKLTCYADYYHFLFLPLEYTLSSWHTENTSGDLNGDGETTEADAVLLSALLAEHPAIDPDWIRFDADLDLNGVLDTRDLMLILRQVEWPTKAVPLLPWWDRIYEDQPGVIYRE